MTHRTRRQRRFAAAFQVVALGGAAMLMLVAWACSGCTSARFSPPPGAAGLPGSPNLPASTQPAALPDINQIAAQVALVAKQTTDLRAEVKAGFELQAAALVGVGNKIDNRTQNFDPVTLWLLVGGCVLSYLTQPLFGYVIPRMLRLKMQGNGHGNGYRHSP